MAPLKAKGDLAELMVAADLLRRGHKVAIPYLCFSIPAAELGDGRAVLHLRLEPARNNQTSGIRWAKDFLTLS